MCEAFGFRPPILARRLSGDSAAGLQCFERLHSLPLLRLNQAIEFALHTVRKFLRECSLNFSAAQRTGQSPADAPAIPATIEPISLDVNRSWADAQFRYSATSRLPAAFLEVPTIQTHALPLFSYRSKVALQADEPLVVYGCLRLGRGLGEGASAEKSRSGRIVRRDQRNDLG